MNRKSIEESSQFWARLKAALMYLGFYKVHYTAQETVVYEPVCERLSYVPEIESVVVSMNRDQFPKARSIDDLKQAKAQAIFRAYVGHYVQLHYDENDVYLSSPATAVDRARVTTH